MFGHQYCLLIAWVVSSLPGCPAVGASWKWSMRSLHVSGSSGTTGVVFLSHWRSPGDLVSLYFFAHAFISPDRRFCACVILCSRVSSAGSASSLVWSLMNISSGRSVRSLLSLSPLSSTGGRESMSAAVCSLPGTCWITRLYSWSSPNQRATLLFTFLGVFQWFRLAWSVSTVTGVSVAAR